MKRLAALAFLLLLCLPAVSALASDPPPFQLLYRQQNVSVDHFNTKSDLLITVINLSGGEARDLVVSIPVANPFFFVDSPIVVGTVPQDRQAEILRTSDMPNDLIEIAELEEDLVWRIEYARESGGRVSVLVKGMQGR